jgi:FixJ family two-component response regulator
MGSENWGRRQIVRERVHIIDPDRRRQASIAADFASRAIDPEVHPSIQLFAESAPQEGLVFAADPFGSEDVLAALETRGSALPVVLYADQPTPEKIVNAMLCGALDYLRWPFDPRLLDLALERLATVGEQRCREARLQAAAAAQIEELTRRERDVLAHLAHGMSNKAIGRALSISHRTVEIHRGNMMRKLGACSTSGAVRIALYAGLDSEFPVGE